MSPRCQKGVPGVPQDVFLASFWQLLEHLGVPGSILTYFGWIFVSPGDPAKKVGGRGPASSGAMRISHVWHLKFVFYLGFNIIGTHLGPQKAINGLIWAFGAV